jgi:hypothetical protein
MVLGGRVHVIQVDLVAEQDGHGPNELPPGIEHEQPRPLRLHHVLQPLGQ